MGARNAPGRNAWLGIPHDDQHNYFVGDKRFCSLCHHDWIEHSHGIEGSCQIYDPETAIHVDCFCPYFHLPGEAKMDFDPFSDEYPPDKLDEWDWMSRV